MLIYAEIMVKELKGKLNGKTPFSQETREFLWWAVLDSNQ
jgi:hypothetical protein